MDKNRTMDESGERVNWLKIKCMRFERAKPQFIMFKYNYSDPEFRMLNVAGRCSRNVNSLVMPNGIPRLYTKQIPISNVKKQDLLKLCKTGAIPSEFHAGYQSIPAENTKKDVAPEPLVWSGLVLAVNRKPLSLLFAFITILL